MHTNNCVCRAAWQVVFLGGTEILLPYLDSTGCCSLIHLLVCEISMWERGLLGLLVYTADLVVRENSCLLEESRIDLSSWMG